MVYVSNAKANRNYTRNNYSTQAALKLKHHYLYAYLFIWVIPTYDETLKKIKHFSTHN